MTIGEIFEYELANFGRLGKDRKADPKFLRYIWTEALLQVTGKEFNEHERRHKDEHRRRFVTDKVEKVERAASKLLSALNDVEIAARRQPEYRGHEFLPRRAREAVPGIERVQAWAQREISRASVDIEEKRPVVTQGRVFFLCALIPYLDFRRIYMKSGIQDGRHKWFERWYQNFGHLEVRDVGGVKESLRSGGLRGQDLDAGKLITEGNWVSEKFDLFSWWKGAKKDRDRREEMCIAASSYVAWSRRAEAARRNVKPDVHKPITADESSFADCAFRFLKREARITRRYVETKTICLLSYPMAEVRKDIRSSR